MNIAEKLKKLREEKGLSQEQLIKALYKEQNEKIAISSIRNYENENNPRIPQGKILLALSRFYNVSLEYLLDDNINAKERNNIDISKKLKLNDESINQLEGECYKYPNEINDFFTSLLFIDLISAKNKLNILRSLAILLTNTFKHLTYNDSKFYITKVKLNYKDNEKVIKSLLVEEFYEKRMKYIDTVEKVLISEKDAYSILIELTNVYKIIKRGLQKADVYSYFNKSVSDIIYETTFEALFSNLDDVIENFNNKDTKALEKKIRIVSSDYYDIKELINNLYNKYFLEVKDSFYNFYYSSLKEKDYKKIINELKIKDMEMMKIGNKGTRKR